jgi:hypothetical protein
MYRVLHCALAWGQHVEKLVIFTYWAAALGSPKHALQRKRGGTHL